MGTRKDLTPEAQEIWDRLSDPNLSVSDVVESIGKPLTKKKEKKTENQELNAIRKSIAKLIANSLRVIAEATTEKESHVAKEEYFKAQRCQVAIELHQNLIKRLSLILEGKDPLSTQ